MKKVVLSTTKGTKGQKKFKVNKSNDKTQERDVELDITSGTTDEAFIVEQLSTDDLDKTILIKGISEEIVWFNNFQIKKESTDEPINQSYNVKITGLKAWKNSGKIIVLQDGNANQGKAYEFTGPVSDDDTIELTDGDPAVGGSPP